MDPARGTDPAPRPRPGPQVAVVLAGAGSSAGFVTRAFGGPLAAAGYRLVAPPPVPGPDVVPAALAALDRARRTYGPRLAIVGGVSLGAHLAVRWAAAAPAGDPPLDGLLLALPAWTGPPGPVASATASSAATVARLGVAGALRRAAAGAVPWVSDELAAAWPGYGDLLAATLLAAAAAPGPDPAQLAAVGVPVGLAAFTDDPMHPVAVAETWAGLLPRAAVHRLRLADLAADRSPLGAAALAALAAAGPAPDRPRAVQHDDRGGGPARVVEE